MSKYFVGQVVVLSHHQVHGASAPIQTDLGNAESDLILVEAEVARSHVKSMAAPKVDTVSRLIMRQYPRDHIRLPYPTIQVIPTHCRRTQQIQIRVCMMQRHIILRHPSRPCFERQWHHQHIVLHLVHYLTLCTRKKMIISLSLCIQMQYIWCYLFAFTLWSNALYLILSTSCMFQLPLVY